MISTSKKGVSYFLECCLAEGVDHIVFSPGSRNAPLVIAFDEHPDIKTYVVHDERSAGFFALGLSLALNKPVAVACTSGSAVVNYYPAVTEAFYQNVPLIVLSADRPERLINQGDGQTIMQKEVFGRHVLSYCEVEEAPVSRAEIHDKVLPVLRLANDNWRGPVHFNFPFEEPLYQKEEFNFEVPSVEQKQPVGFEGFTESQKSKWLSSERKLILVGQLLPSSRTEFLLSELAKDTSVAVLTECTSNCVSMNFNHCIDRSLAAIKPEEIEEYKPDFLLTVGGAVVSKRIKQFLRESELREHWNVSYAFPEMDTYFKKTQQFECDLNSFLEKLAALRSEMPISNYGSKWKQIDFKNQDKLNAFRSDYAFSDFAAMDVILDSIPERSTIHLGNSTPIRYAQLFDPVKGLVYNSNRGTSGIDGSLSTAIGFASARPNELNVIVTGDVSFFYDSNALWNAYIGSNVKIVLINNGGGGIFRIIDGPAQSEQLEHYFEAKHDHSAEHLCKAFGISYFSANDLKGVEAGMRSLLLSESAALLEVFTPNEENARVLKEFFGSLI